MVWVEVVEMKKPWGEKKAKMQPRRTPMKTATAIREAVIEWFLSLVSNASLRPAIDVYQISIGNLKVNWKQQPLDLLFLRVVFNSEGGTTNNQHIIGFFFTLTSSLIVFTTFMSVSFVFCFGNILCLKSRCTSILIFS